MVARLASALAPSASFRSPRNGTRPKRHHGWTQVPDLKIPLPYPEPPLTDGVIVLRRWKRTDLSCVEEASHDTRIPEGTTVPSVFTKREGLAWIERQWGRADNGEGLSLAITDAQSDEAVGAVTMTLRPQEGQQRGTAAIGYWIIGALAVVAKPRAPLRCSLAGRLPKQVSPVSRRWSNPTTLLLSAFSNTSASSAKATYGLTSRSPSDGPTR
jgi:hypothetical protein